MNMYDDFFVGGQWVAKKEVLERLSETGIVESVMSHDVKRKGRTIEQVANDCTRGLAAEVGIAIITKGELNPQQFDITNRDSYGWDVKCGITGEKLEIKNHQNKWWSYSPKNVQTLARNISEKVFDKIITAKVDEDDEGFTIWPRLVIDPTKWRQYSRRSQYNGSLYWDHQTARRNNDCTVYNEDIIGYNSAINKELK